MNPQRLSQATFNQANAEPLKPSAFVMVQISRRCRVRRTFRRFITSCNVQALQANQSRRLPDLFCVMN